VTPLIPLMPGEVYVTTGNDDVLPALVDRAAPWNGFVVPGFRPSVARALARLQARFADDVEQDQLVLSPDRRTLVHLAYDPDAVAAPPYQHAVVALYDLTGGRSYVGARRWTWQVVDPRDLSLPRETGVKTGSDRRIDDRSPLLQLSVGDLGVGDPASLGVDVWLYDVADVADVADGPDGLGVRDVLDELDGPSTFDGLPRYAVRWSDRVANVWTERYAQLDVALCRVAALVAGERQPTGGFTHQPTDDRVWTDDAGGLGPTAFLRDAVRFLGGQLEPPPAR
jgi:hypothetical protein